MRPRFQRTDQRREAITGSTASPTDILPDPLPLTLSRAPYRVLDWNRGLQSRWRTGGDADAPAGQIAAVSERCASSDCICMCCIAFCID